MATYEELAGALEAVLRASSGGRTLVPDGSLTNMAQRLVDEAKAGQQTEIEWTPFVAGEAVSVSLSSVKVLAQMVGQPEAVVEAQIREELMGSKIYINSRYQVAMRSFDDDFHYLSIKRIDQTPVRSWRDLQRIKTELVGSANEGFEIYPDEARLLDVANQYHLFVLKDPTLRLPVGFDEGRFVSADIDIGEGQASFEA